MLSGQQNCNYPGTNCTAAKLAGLDGPVVLSTNGVLMFLADNPNVVYFLFVLSLVALLFW